MKSAKAEVDGFLKAEKKKLQEQKNKESPRGKEAGGKGQA